jgi:uncharacterized protein YjcR
MYVCIDHTGKRCNELAHRVAYKLYKGHIPKGMLVCHTCDNRQCVNPEHLFLGTAQDNTNDMVQKGRARGNPNAAGENGTKAKLSWEQVKEIREAKQNGLPLRALAVAFGVTPSTIQKIVTHQTWKERNN